MRVSGTLFLSIFLTAACLGQHYPILPVPGSPHGIFTMMQDSRSALWLGTIDDVYCFDGEHFYSLRQYGFPKETPNSFAEDSEGGIWIGTQGTAANGGSGHGGLYRYRAGRVTRVFSGDSLSIVAPSPGIVLASFGTEANGKPTYGDLYVFHGSGTNWNPARLADQQADHLSVDHGGDVLFPCPRGWCEIAHPQVTALAGPNARVDLARHAGSALIERVLRDRYGCLWFRAEAFASYQCPSDLQPVMISDDISEYDPTAHLEESSDGSIFMLQRMVLGRPGTFKGAVTANGVPSGMGTAMVARDGTIWIGARDGLYRFMHPFRIESWGQADGIIGAYTILRVGKDLLASDGRLNRLSGDRSRWEHISGLDGFSQFVEGPSGTLIETDQNRIRKFDLKGKTLAQSFLPIELYGGEPLARGRPGQIWLGLNGISRVVDRGSTFTLQREDLPAASISHIRYDAARDILWACYGNGVAFRRDGIWRTITPKDGLLDLECGKIAVEQNGDVWMAYRADAVSLIEDPASGHPRIRNYNQWLNQIAYGDGFAFLGFDSRGWLWAGTHFLRVAAPGAARADQWIELNASDGIAPAGSFLAEPDGSVWFGSDGGITHFSPPPDFLTNFPAPPVFVSGFSSAQAVPKLVDAIQPMPRAAQVTAHIGMLQFDRRNAIRLRYRLLPEQSAWQTASAFDIPLGKLHWGTHRLQVQAQLSSGPWSAVAEESFTVLKPLWITWPAIAGYLAGLFSGGFGIRAWRRRRASRAKKKFPELANWRLAALSPELNQLAGTIIEARFEVGTILARGGFATVTRGRDLHQGGLHCAIKIFRQELMDKEWLARRFQQEVRALASIDHPNVVRIYGHGSTAKGTPYLVMEFIDGTTLRERLEQGRLSPLTTASYLRQTGSALDEIHAREICHRDLKPENLMVRRDAAPGRELVLIDFSIAIVKDPDETMHGLSRAAGTLYYMAPEQAIGYADPSTDIYSLAKIVIEMLTGRRLSDLLPNASMDLSERVRELLAGLPIRLSSASIELLGSGLEFDPARRPKIAGIFANTIADDLERASTDEP